MASKLDVTKAVAEICAIVIGGSWVLFTFWVKDCPNLERRILVSTDLQWRKAGDRCHAAVVVSVENNGGSPVDVTQVALRGWGFASPVATTTAYFDQSSVSQTGSPLPTPDSVSEALGLLATHYPVSTKAHQTLEWSFPADAGRSVYFEVSATAEGVPGTPRASTWDRVCGTALSTKTPDASASDAAAETELPPPTSTAIQ